jgi:hypothetical protein
VIALRGVKGVLGVKVSTAPRACHEPDVAGTSLGRGEPLASPDENVTVTDVSDATPLAPDDGLTDATLSGVGVVVVGGEVEEVASLPGVVVGVVGEEVAPAPPVLAAVADG